MCSGRLQRIRGDEVVGFEEVAAAIGPEKHDDREEREEHDDAHQVFHRVIRVKRNSVDRMSGLRIFLVLDLDAVRVVRTHLVQRHQVHRDEQQQHERHRDDVKREKAVQRHVRNRVVAADPGAQIVTDDRDGREQVDDHLRAPVRHLSPRQQVTEERFGHQREVDEAADDPQQLARFAVAAVKQRPEHVQVHDDEERRCARRVCVADEPAARDVAHDVFDRLERLGRVGLVVHRQENAGDDLHHEHDQRQRAEEVPEVEILRRVVFRHLRFPQCRHRKAVVDPGHYFLHVRGAPPTPTWHPNRPGAGYRSRICTVEW